jgi:hypothetical protein
MELFMIKQIREWVPFLASLGMLSKIIISIIIILVAVLIIIAMWIPEEFPENKQATDNSKSEGGIKKPASTPSIKRNLTVYGDVVFSQNQSGGQTAKTIINKRPKARTIKHARNKIISELKTVEPEYYKIYVLMNDMEAQNLATEIKDVMDTAGWTDGKIEQRLGGKYPPGFTVSCNKPSKAGEVITLALYNSGLHGAMWSELRGEHLVIYIGPHPDTYSGDFKQNIKLTPREFE